MNKNISLNRGCWAKEGIVQMEYFPGTSYVSGVLVEFNSTARPIRDPDYYSGTECLQYCPEEPRQRNYTEPTFKCGSNLTLNSPELGGHVVLFAKEQLLLGGHPVHDKDAFESSESVPYCLRKRLHFSPELSLWLLTRIHNGEILAYGNNFVIQYWWYSRTPFHCPQVLVENICLLIKYY